MYLSTVVLNAKFSVGGDRSVACFIVPVVVVQGMPLADKLADFHVGVLQVVYRWFDRHSQSRALAVFLTSSLMKNDIFCIFYQANLTGVDFLNRTGTETR